MDKKTQIMIGFLAAFGGGFIIFILGMAYDLVPFNTYSHQFWIIFLVFILYFAIGGEIKNIPSMTVSYICGLVWGFLSCVSAYLWQASNHTLFAFINYFLIASLIVFVHKGLLGNTVFGNPMAAFLGMALSIFVATCSVPSSTGEYLAPNTWNFVDLFIIYLIAIFLCFFVSIFTGFLIKNYLKMKQKKEIEK